MTAKALLCIFAGHKWAPAKDSYEAQTVMVCGRCGRRQIRSAEQRVIEGFGRGRRVR